MLSQKILKTIKVQLGLWAWLTSIGLVCVGFLFSYIFTGGLLLSSADVGIWGRAFALGMSLIWLVLACLGAAGAISMAKAKVKLSMAEIGLHCCLVMLLAGFVINSGRLC